MTGTGLGSGDGRVRNQVNAGVKDAGQIFGEDDRAVHFREFA